jgi:hypothetical protein
MQLNLDIANCILIFIILVLVIYCVVKHTEKFHVNDAKEHIY